MSRGTITVDGQTVAIEQCAVCNTDVTYLGMSPTGDVCEACDRFLCHEHAQWTESPNYPYSICKECADKELHS